MKHYLPNIEKVLLFILNPEQSLVGLIKITRVLLKSDILLTSSWQGFQ